MSKLTPDQVEDIVSRRERGWSYDRIAARHGVTAGAVHYQCLKHGAVSPKARRKPVPTEPSAIVARDGRTQRRFTQADDARLLELEAKGMKYTHIAREIGRAYTSVRIRLMTLALHEDVPVVGPVS